MVGSKVKPIVSSLGNPRFDKIFNDSKEFIDSKPTIQDREQIILIGSKSLLKSQLNDLKCSFKINEIRSIKKARKNVVNIINVKFKYKKIYSEISIKSNSYIKKCFDISLKILKNNPESILINGPISKKTFLKKK